tara:strand:- start:5388 stop:6098 length:711 start_codon:yes stop_codon:yes gene_type:complete
MAFVLAGVIVAGATGLVKVGVGVSQKNKAKKRQAAAKEQMEADKDAYMNAPITNPYDNMENTMEDLTVNTQAADFAAQKSEQARADIMGGMAGTAGASGIAALAQTMANTANQEAQAASASIATQEAANQKAERKEAGNIQELERQGEAQVENLKRDRMATQLGMSQSEYGAESQNVADAQASIMSGVGDIGGAAGSFIGAGGFGGNAKKIKGTTSVVDDPYMQAQTDYMKSQRKK